MAEPTIPDPAIYDSVLNTIKVMLGQQVEDDTYDVDIMNHINTVFFELNQLGVGPAGGHSIYNSTDSWNNYTGGVPNLNSVKTYVYLRVKLMFDPPATGPLATAMKEQADKLEWRLSVEVDRPLQNGRLTTGGV